jgi:hypothetical protein
MRKKCASGFAGAGAEVHGAFASIDGNSGEDVLEELGRVFGPVAMEFLSGATESGLEGRWHVHRSKTGVIVLRNPAWRYSHSFCRADRGRSRAQLAGDRERSSRADG